MKKSENREPVSIGHRLSTIIGAVICIILIPVLIINCTLIIQSYTNKDTVPSVGGVFPMIILTDSMEPEFSSGDLIICKRTDAEDVKQGDIICFYDPDGNGTTTVTHRVEKITQDENGNLAWETKGDANNTKDAAIVPAEKLAGVYLRNISGVGNVAMFMQTTQGLIICVICPIILLLAYDIIRRKIYEKSRKKDTDALLAELNELRAEKEKNEKKHNN